MLKVNERALFLAYGYEPEEYVKLSVNNGLRSVDIKIFVNAMSPEIQKELRKLDYMDKWTGIQYSAEVDENGNILYFTHVEIVPLEQIVKESC